MSWYIECLSKYAIFSGRSRRKEFWMFWLVNNIIGFVLGVVGEALAWAYSGEAWFTIGTERVFNPYTYSYSDVPIIIWSEEHSMILGIFLIIALVYSLAVLLPWIAVSVRRMHDIGKSGGYAALFFIPGARFILMLVYACRDGVPGTNQYGPDPKGRSSYSSGGYNSGIYNNTGYNSFYNNSYNNNGYNNNGYNNGYNNSYNNNNNNAYTPGIGDNGGDFNGGSSAGGNDFFS